MTPIGEIMIDVFSFLDKSLIEICQTNILRRQNLLKLMQELEVDKKDCQKCAGDCCTFVANSMQVDPIQALEILVFYTGQGLLNIHFVKKLKDCVDQFRLDVVLNFAGKFRRTYTCPLYKGHCLGCSLPKNIRPYGCLGFNPIRAAVRENPDCCSYLEQLETRQRMFKEMEFNINSDIKKNLGLLWDKREIPVALLDLINQMDAHGLTQLFQKACGKIEINV